MIGAKGVPATVGGVERIVEELGARLVERGHRVTVYCRAGYAPPPRGGEARPWRGLERRWPPCLPGKYTDTLSHAFTSLLHALASTYDVLHVHSLGTAPILPLARLARRRVLFHIHGQEWRGGKWGARARAYFKWCERPGLRYPDEVVVISRVLRDYYRETYGAETTYIPNAVEVTPARDTGILAELGLAPRGFLLFVGRLVPEKGCHFLLEAHRRLGLDLPVVVVGDSSHSDDYVSGLRAAAGPRVIFAGVVTGERLADLFARALMVVHPSEREGMSLVLLEAMGQGACVLASDIPEMIEGVGGAGHHFAHGDAADLAARLRRLLDDPVAIDAVRAPAAARIREHHAWPRITDQFEAAYARLVG